MTRSELDIRRIQPTLETKFHIDYDWWKRSGQDLRIYLISHLLPDQQTYFAEHASEEESDWVDPKTGEVRRVDALDMALQEAARNPDFITQHTSLVDAVFRALLANNNTPMTPIELSERTGKSPATILRTLWGNKGQVYKGIRPYLP